MLTPEQRAKLKAAGYSDTKINVFEAQKAMKEAEAQPKEPTLGGKIVRETIRPLAEVATNVVNAGQIIAGKEETQPFSGDYLGEVGGLGKVDITKSPLDKENLKTIKKSVKVGTDLGLLVAGGGGAGSVAKTGIKEGIIQGVKAGAKTGAIIGGASGASTGLEEGATLGSTLKNTAIGAGTGAIVGGAVGGVSGGVSSAVKGAKKVGEVSGKAVKNKAPKLLSIFTGEDDDVVTKAMQFPDEADLGIKGGDEALRKAVQVGSDSSIKAKNTFVKAHSDAFKKLAGKNSKQLIDRKNIVQQFANELKDSGVTSKNGKLNFAISKINTNPGEVSKIQAVQKAITGWKDFSLTGMNELKQLVGQYTKFANEAGGTSKSPFLGKFYNYLDSEIKRNLPKGSSKAYATMNKKFADSIGLYDDMVDAFNSGDPFTKLAGLFSKNKDSLRQIVDFYEKTTGKRISPIVAGRTLAESKPAAFGFLNPRQWIDFFVDPKTQAKLVTKTGRLIGKQVK